MNKQISSNDDFLWGAAAIADYLSIPRWKVYYLLSKKHLPATKLGAKTIVARKSELDASMSASEG
jgi:excisionase family DNA binding protein